jgi:hypothetical protein
MHESFRINQYLHTFVLYKLIKFPLFICNFAINFSVIEKKTDISNNGQNPQSKKKKDRRSK